MSGSFLHKARTRFHNSLLEKIFWEDERGVPFIADKDSPDSVLFAKGVLKQLGGAKHVGKRFPGQTTGRIFETICLEYLQYVFPKFEHLRPAVWKIASGSLDAITQSTQYDHLASLKTAIERNDDLEVSLGYPYIIKPDILITRNPLKDSAINRHEELVSSTEANYTSLRMANQEKPILHASVSCKWTLRSDRAQNARSEASNLVRNRKGRLPHIAVIVADPLPSRIASIANGTGDIDCIYHIALPELIASVSSDKVNNPDQIKLLSMMVNGKRLGDISDLPLDLMS